MLETNIDDCSAEVLGYVMEKLMDYALDVFYTPIFMKKNRPSYKLSVLCYEKYEKQVESIIFKNTTSIGIRKYGVERSILDRKIEQFYIDDISLKIAQALYKNLIILAKLHDGIDEYLHYSLRYLNGIKFQKLD